MATASLATGLNLNRIGTMDLARVVGSSKSLSAARQESTRKPSAQGDQSYYGLPALKAPVWTWEVPLYFFLGGIAGLSTCVAFVAQSFRSDPALIRVSLWAALLGAAMCPVLLIADLGRPTRFLNMLRVFKLRSAMSLGAWILAAFSGCAFVALFCFELLLRGFTNPLLTSLLWLEETSAAAVGLLLASYTAVLIGATAIPVWSENRKLLPVHFLTSGLGCSAAILELAGFLIPATQILGFAASGIETVIEIFLEVRKRPLMRHYTTASRARHCASLDFSKGPPHLRCAFSGAHFLRDAMPPRFAS
jgi:hypothetical protein